jgi:GT2 family glycosyltransferase
VAGRIDVVVPAHNEEALLGACLTAVVRDAGELDVRVIVVANGCTDSTVEVAERVIKEAASWTNVAIVVLELPDAAKPAALNAATDMCRGCPVIYLDADTVITPGTLLALSTTMDAADGPVLVAPRPVLVRPKGGPARGFAVVWSSLPAVRDDVIGAGCYAVNAQGRQRWTAFPDLTADDAYVRSLFTRDERKVVGRGGFLLVLPAWPELSRVLARWRRGNAELGESASPAAGGRRNAVAVLAEPALWRHLAPFLWVQGTSRLQRRPRWARADGVRGSQSLGGGPHPDDLVVVGSTANLVDELRALAIRFPAAGLYGGPMVRPTLRRAIAFGFGLSGLHRQAPGLVVERGLLRRLGGVDERYLAHGAAIDVVLRARRRGIRPVSIVGTGFPKNQETGAVLHDEIALHRAHMPAWRGRLAGRALILGTRLRALARPNSQWAQLWQNRDDWAGRG